MTAPESALVWSLRRSGFLIVGAVLLMTGGLLAAVDAQTRCAKQPALGVGSVHP